MCQHYTCKFFHPSCSSHYIHLSDIFLQGNIQKVDLNFKETVKLEVHYSRPFTAVLLVKYNIQDNLSGPITAQNMC